MSMGGSLGGTAAALPPLRDDLVLARGPAAHDGSPTWTLHDPAANRFHRIGWLEFEILGRWGLGRADAVAAAVRQATPLHVEAGDVAVFARHAAAAELLRGTDPAATERMMERVRHQRQGPLFWLLKNYLFLRIPLIRPDRALASLLPAVAWMFSTGFLLAVALTALAGLFLITRQWDTFVHGFPYMTTPEGIVLTGAALLLAKVLHELGHAFAARRFGCRVPAMGVAFMVLWPVLWTDTTEAWKLRSRWQRLIIDGAGVMVELALAAAASVVWSVLPDGPARTAVFLLASSTWVLTLAVNLNPFMRFDGYFLLSDLLDVPNLQDRSFALARWRLRAALFGLKDPPPEALSDGRRRLLIAYAVGTWVYRFFLFLGLALLVYVLFFKALGVVLMAVEVGWFIVRPVVTELRAWHRRRADVRWNRNTAATLAAVAGLVVLALVPWRTHVTAPALLRAERQAVLYALQGARIAAMPARQGAMVTEGDELFRLYSPDLAHKLRVARHALDLLRAQLAYQGVDPELAQQLPVLVQEAGRLAADVEVLEAESQRLSVRAPFAGRLSQVGEALSLDGWVAAREPLAVLTGGAPVVEALVAEEDVALLAVGNVARFHAETGDRPPLALRVASIDPVALRALEDPELASANGGAVAARVDGKGRLVPETAVYRVRLVPLDALPLPERTVRGTAAVEAERRSWIAGAWRLAVSAFIRESGVS